MTTVPVTQRMSADEFLAIPEGEGPRWQELVDGELVVNEPTVLHNLVQTALLLAIGSWAKEAAGRGWVYVPLDVKIDERNVFAPDISWYSQERRPEPDALPPYRCPDLAIEVRSPSTWRYDVGAKKSAYERRGLPELWLVDTAAAEVLVFRRSRPGAPSFDVALELEDGETLGSPLLPGFALGLGELFAT